MELLQAVNRLNRLKDDAEKIESWLNQTRWGGNQPVKGLSWRKVEKAIDEVLEDLWEEYRVLEAKVNTACEGIEVDHK